MQINSTNVMTMDKFQKASPMNVPEETKCCCCEQMIFERELFMLCQVKGFKGDIALKNFCCDCFKKKVEEDIERIQKWYNKTTQELMGMYAPIQEYMESDTKKRIDANRKMLNRIEGNDGKGEF